MNKRENKHLKIVEAHEHNLKHINVEIPHGAMTVITGVSGSGKSTLAYNVIFKESQRRFLESFSAYSRQYLGKLEKPKVKEITGLQAALAINQKTAVANPRSTVGTMSGIYDYLRLLYARIGTVETRLIASQPLNRPLQAKLFSFNSNYGACPECKGLGLTEHIDKQKLISNHALSLREGALVPTTPNGYIVYSQVRVDELNKVCEAHDFSVDIPWKNLSREQQDVIWYGSEKVKILFGKHSLESRLKWKGITAKPREEAYYKGMIPIMEEILKRDRNDNILRFASSFTCDECGGSRLRKEVRSVLINKKNISELCEFSLSGLYIYLKDLDEHLSDNEVSKNILEHVLKRLEYLQLLGLSYLTLARESTTLSGGEAQRIRLASQLGSGLQGILYILDEPSIGLHNRDNKKLLKVLKSLRDNGNTVLVVEHDEDTIRSADYLIDIGPKAGIEGGEVIYQGEVDTLLHNKNDYPLSLTAHTISVEPEVYLPKSIRSLNGFISIKGASKFNLKKIDIDFRIGAFNVVTGVSGAGKSTLVHKVLGRYLKNQNHDGSFKSINCTTPITRLIEIDQSPIGRTPRSNPATYTDLFDHIRNLFASLPESKKRAYNKGRFSFNNVGGRCETCQGAGYIHLGMHFLGDMEIVCVECNGKRFNDETLEIVYKNKNIFEVLELSIEEAWQFFDGEARITKILNQLIALDVGYLKLGQPSTSLSGGEAQRIKLASELYKTSKGHALYILDEPTTGLHKADIKHLLIALNKIVNNDNTVIVIEHDTDIIKQADHIIDLGPDGGDKGGYLVAQGDTAEIMSCDDSYTGKALKEASDKNKFSSSKSEKKQNPENIKFYGVTTNNLKNIDIEIPLNQTTVITGISGSGKTSLAFDTIYSESRNRFTENLSTYARRMMSKVKKPELEQCSGLTPAIAVRQNQFRKNPRSTVGTVTEIFDLYRLLFSRAGFNKNGNITKLPASMFSFNKLAAACPKCKGLGNITTSDPEKFITHPEKAIIAGAMDGTTPGKFFGDIYGQYINTLIKVGELKGIDFTLPYHKLSQKAVQIALFGTGTEEYDVEWKFRRGNRTGTHNLTTVWKGFVNYLNEDWEIKHDSKRGEAFKAIMSEINCSACQGKRFRKNILDVSFDGMNISQLSSKTITNAIEYFSNIQKEINPDTFAICEQIIVQLITKLKPLDEIGLGYLSIDRTTQTLSGGEAQRLRIASQLVSDLCGLTYVLDEPTLGLHPRDTQNLMKSIRKLKDNGNTVILVEHDPDVISHADHIIDMGQGAGENGGKIIAQGSINDIIKNPKSITGKYLSKDRQEIIRQKINKQEREPGAGISITGAYANNLKNISINIPAGGIIAVTGVSGSGKTSLAFDVIADSFKAGRAVNCDNISFANIDSVVVIDQQKIGTSPLSTPATYTGLFDIIRDLFARLDESKARGLKKLHFSFNSKEGRCPACKGMGNVKVSMDFLSDVWVSCDTCHGKRYKDSILKIRYKNLNINEVLELEVSEAYNIFEDNTKIRKILCVLRDIGLGYLKLGQSTSTLSGGETQRLKLASELIREFLDNCLFIFDEPTTGLHMQDVEKLIAVFNKLVNNGNTVLLVEHNLEIIRTSDWIIDLGPEGGDKGGEVVYSSISSKIVKCNKSYTGKALSNKH
ncbi:MAG: excinuclease ABC subunit UvrA [Bacteroidales bacterium]|nr:excinuclease ABC subunit UvrA [Bacteroidales bacterium]